MGVEQPFNRNVTTAIPVGQARGIVLLTAAENQIDDRTRTATRMRAIRSGLWQSEQRTSYLYGNKIVPSS